MERPALPSLYKTQGGSISRPGVLYFPPRKRHALGSGKLCASRATYAAFGGGLDDRLRAWQVIVNDRGFRRWWPSRLIE
jgi:hypothetical protein